MERVPCMARFVEGCSCDVWFTAVKQPEKRVPVYGDAEAFAYPKIYQDFFFTLLAQPWVAFISMVMVAPVKLIRELFMKNELTSSRKHFYTVRHNMLNDGALKKRFDLRKQDEELKYSD